MKQFFFLTLIVISGVASAQPYKSIFGNASTMWIIKWYNLDFGGMTLLWLKRTHWPMGIIGKR